MVSVEFVDSELAVIKYVVVICTIIAVVSVIVVKSGVVTEAEAVVVSTSAVGPEVVVSVIAALSIFEVKGVWWY